MLPPFQTLVDRHRRDVWRFLVTLVGPDEADDCFQETFLAALRGYPKVRGGNLRAWLLAIAHSKAMDAHRGRRRAPHAVDRVPESAAEVVPQADGEVWAEVRKLPPRQRAAVVYRYVNDLSYRDIARNMSCTEEAARQNVREGIRKLKETLG